MVMRFIMTLTLKPSRFKPPPFLPTLENFLHTKLHTIFISNISAIKITNPLEFSSNICKASIKTLYTVATSSKSSFPQKN